MTHVDDAAHMRALFTYLSFIAVTSKSGSLRKKYLGMKADLREEMSIRGVHPTNHALTSQPRVFQMWKVRP